MLKSFLGPEHAFTQTSQKMVESCESLISMVRVVSSSKYRSNCTMVLMIPQRDLNHKGEFMRTDFLLFVVFQNLTKYCD